MFVKRSKTLSSKPRKTGPRQPSIVLGAVLLLASVIGASAQTGHSGVFTNASLWGSYSAQSEGDNRVAVGLGIATYNGKGKTTRRLTVNAPAEDGARRLLLFQDEGTYSINEDGTGTVTYEITNSDGTVREVTWDLVITRARITFLSGQRSKLATELFAVQREVGVAASLVTSNQQRLP